MVSAGPAAALSPGESFQPAAAMIPLNQDDAAAIYDLRMAYHNSLEVSGDGGDLSRHHANLSDLVNIAELSVRRVIAMAKQVPAFRALPQVSPSLSLSLYISLYVAFCLFLRLVVILRVLQSLWVNLCGCLRCFDAVS